MKRYEPNDRDRQVVLVMAAIPGVTYANIAKAILNELSGKPITEKTLRRHYKAELDDAMVGMQRRVMTKFIELIDQGDWRAVQMGLSNYCRIKDDGPPATAISQNIVNNLRLNS